jgi:hypothetical protein
MPAHSEPGAGVRSGMSAPRAGIMGRWRAWGTPPTPTTRLGLATGSHQSSSVVPSAGVAAFAGMGKRRRLMLTLQACGGRIASRLIVLDRCTLSRAQAIRSTRR